MKKGDIVKPKPADKDWIEYLFRYHNGVKALMPEYFTLKSDPKTIVGCGPNALFIQFEESGGSFIPSVSYFEVVLEAGKPDVNEIMNQVEAVEVFV